MVNHLGRLVVFLTVATCPALHGGLLSIGLLSIGMQWISMHCIPVHSIANGFHSSGIDTIDWIGFGKDTYALVALEAPEQETGLLTRSDASGARRRGAGRGRWRLSGPARAAKWARGA